MDKHIKMLGKIKTREKFIEFMKLYIPTVEDSAVKAYLESIAAWTEDMDGYYHNTKKEIPQNINWDFIASLLYIGSIYE
ncbi:MAG: hypothetical protein IJ642_12375 [Oscillospiraceae bacterium]|nr:hypothetical protein [Oscillospiraceae bacterium]